MSEVVLYYDVKYTLFIMIEIAFIIQIINRDLNLMWILGPRDVDFGKPWAESVVRVPHPMAQSDVQARPTPGLGDIAF